MHLFLIKLSELFLIGFLVLLEERVVGRFVGSEMWIFGGQTQERKMGRA
jgi:hypothetical protein